MVFMPERSNSVRSASAMNFSAALSVFSFGNFFIVIDLLLVHVARADRTDEPFAFPPSQRENDQDASALTALANGLEPGLAPRMRGVGENGNRPLKQRFNLGDGDAVLLAFL